MMLCTPRFNTLEHTCMCYCCGEEGGGGGGGGGSIGNTGESTKGESARDTSNGGAASVL